MIEKSLQDLKGLISVSLGERPADLVVRDADIFDVFSGALFKGNIQVYRHWIAYVGERAPAVSDKTVIVDGKGKVAVPGYVDAHGHADLFLNPSAFADVAVTRGATTVFSDSQDMVYSIGVSGFIEVMKASDGFALKYLWSFPAAYPPYPAVEGGDIFSLHDLVRLFSDYKDCIAMSEVSSYGRILKNEDSILEKMLLTRFYGRNIEGHTLGASYDKLNTLAAAGISSCHESIKEDDLRNRVRLGLYGMIRHSSMRSDLEELCRAANTLPKDSLLLVSDGILPGDLAEKGYLDFIVRDAIGFGLDPMDAIKMVTLNAARYLKREADIGSIAPGRIADILLLEDMAHPTPLKVIEKGGVVSEEGRLLVESTPFPDVGSRYHPYVFDRVDRDEFRIESKGKEKVPVIDLVDKTVTKRLDRALSREGDYLLPDRNEDIRKVVYTRRDRKHWGRAFVRGLGADIGGIALSVAHETHGLLVLGFDDDDMALAGNRVLGMGGGIALANRGEIIRSLALPLGATMSPLPVRELAAELGKMNEIIRSMGSPLDDPLITMTYITLTSIIELRLTVSGVYDVKKGRIVF